jgi:dephospho-CoA kinase
VPEFDRSSDPSLWRRRLHASADPGRPTNVHVRVDGWPNQQFALLFVDWLEADAGARADYAMSDAYAEATEPWLVDAYRKAWQWADQTAWRP